MSTLAVVAEVLREVAPGALRARQIAELAGTRLRTLSKTPETVISRDLSLDVRGRGATSRFLRAGRGAFVLKEALPTSFFNDNDAYAAAWTRKLIAAGEIAAGVVDERSIRDLKPADVASYRQCHFFSGIGVWSRALRDAGWPDTSNVWTGSCPCIPFSSAGNRRGFSDEQHLWPEWFRLIAACRPAWIFGEQVSSKDGLSWLDAVRSDLEGANYSLRVLDIPAACCGAPHRRQRLYFVAYARERAAEILGAAWLRARADRNVAHAGEGGREIIGSPGLHDRGQPGVDAPGRGAADGGDTSPVSDAPGTRSQVSQDAGADRGDACAREEPSQRQGAGDLEPERSGTPDEVCSEDDRANGVGNTNCSRGGRDSGEVSRAQEVGAGERCEAWDLTDESRAAGSTHGGTIVADSGGSGSEGGSFPREVGLVRGATDAAESDSDGFLGFRPGDRIRIADDPTWGGAVRGYWATGVEWIYCRPATVHQGGCWRPTCSGVEPLVNGSSPGVGRTRSKRLRGYGNAIVKPLAAAFVGAVIDTLAESVHATDEEAV